MVFLEINGNKLVEGVNYILEFYGNLIEKIKSVWIYSFIINEFFRGGNCIVDKFEGIVLEMNFIFLCFGWFYIEKELVY